MAIDAEEGWIAVAERDNRWSDIAEASPMRMMNIRQSAFAFSIDTFKLSVYHANRRRVAAHTHGPSRRKEWHIDGCDI
jgi:hypothetical protein